METTPVVPVELDYEALISLLNKSRRRAVALSKYATVRRVGPTEIAIVGRLCLRGNTRVALTVKPDRIIHHRHIHNVWQCLAVNPATAKIASTIGEYRRLRVSSAEVRWVPVGASVPRPVVPGEIMVLLRQCPGAAHVRGLIRSFVGVKPSKDCTTEADWLAVLDELGYATAVVDAKDLVYQGVKLGALTGPLTVEAVTQAWPVVELINDTDPLQPGDIYLYRNDGLGILDMGAATTYPTVAALRAIGDYRMFRLVPTTDPDMCPKESNAAEWAGFVPVVCGDYIVAGDQFYMNGSWHETRTAGRVFEPGLYGAQVYRRKVAPVEPDGKEQCT